MEDTTAKQYIRIYEREVAIDQNFKTNLWQPTADLIHPRMNQISKFTEQGSKKEEEIFNTVAALAAEDAASGLSGMMIPNGQEFYTINLLDKSKMTSRVQRYLNYLTQRSHELIFETNFLPEFNEALLSFLVFGPCNLFSEWDYKEDHLNFLNFDIGTYTICRNSRGKVVAVFVKWSFAASEAVKVFGERAGAKVTESANNPEKENERFEYLHIVEPRDTYHPKMKRLSLSMPWRSVWICLKDTIVSKEGGYLHNPYAITGWRRSNSEKWERGRGVMALPAVRQLQQMELDLTECGNKHNNPPLEILESFEGEVKVTPGAHNFVQELNTIREMRAQGNYPVSKEEFERKKEEVENMFLMKIFRQFIDLAGDRRTTIEIRERKSQAVRLVGSPLINAYNGLVGPPITRSILLLIRHGKIIFEGSPNPPDELAGKEWGLEYQGELALALRDSQARGFMSWTGYLGNIGAIFPQAHVEDYISFERALPRMGKAFGVNADDFATEEEVIAKRNARAQQMAKLEQMQAVAGAADAYKSATKAPEQGSPAEQIIEQAG